MSKENETSFGTATRVFAGDDGTNYDRVAIALHWATAVLVVLQMALAQMWDLWDRPAHRFMTISHMSLGVVLTGIIVARIMWRLIPGHQVPAANVGIAGIAAKAVHYLLYAMLAAEAVLGFVLRWSEGKPMNFFGLLIPAPFEKWSREAHHQVGEIHEWNGWAIIAIATLHALAALYHHYALKDRVLLRMLPAYAERRDLSPR
jgi:cytochrome b561